MKAKRTWLIPALAAASPLLIGLMLWFWLPDQIPVHFNSEGNPDNQLAKWIVVFVFPLGAALLTCLLAGDEKSLNVYRFKILRIFITWIIPAVSIAGICFCYFYSLTSM